jgi:DNA-binding phage protein
VTLLTLQIAKKVSHVDNPESIAAYLGAAFEDGDPALTQPRWVTLREPWG